MSVQALTSENFATTIGSGVALVDFYADWCMPCKMLSPTIQALGEDYEGKAIIAKLNIDDAQAIAAQYGVMSIPTIILFKDGEIVAKKVGSASKADYAKMLDEALG